MFYYPNVLHRHGGCFSTIWLVATRAIRVTRRELLKVNVKLTCRDIMNYVTAQVPPPQPNLPKPQFSLYLSSQLQYGVVVVYHRQCDFLLEEIQQAIIRLMRAEKSSRIDMDQLDKCNTFNCTIASYNLDGQDFNVPDNLNMMKMMEGAQDPFFGLMEVHHLPSPYMLHQPELVMEEVVSQHSLVPSDHTTPANEGFRSPPDAITMTEKQQVAVTAAQGLFEGDELPVFTEREFDMLIDEHDQFRGEVASRQTAEGAVSSFDQLIEQGTERDSVWLLDEDSGQPVMVPLASCASETTPTQVAMPPPPDGSSDRATKTSCGEAVAPQKKKRSSSRRRQLVFVDPQVQVSERTMTEQIGNQQAETVKLSEVLVNYPSLAKHAAPAQLFSAPSGLLLHADLLSLWKQCICIPPQYGEQNRGEEEARGESEQDREILRTEGVRGRSGMKETHSESGLHPPDASSVSDVILDMSKEDKSQSDLITPGSRWSPQEENRLLMAPIAEETIEMPEAQSDAETRHMLSWITSDLQRFGTVTFTSLLPPEADRSTAAHMLYKLLELLSIKQVTAHQAEPYSDITIFAAALSMTA